MARSDHPARRSSPTGPNGISSSRATAPHEWAAVLFHGAGEIVALVSEKGALRYVGGATQELLGLESQQISSWPPLERVHPDDRRLMGQLLNLHRQPLGAVVSLHYRVRHQSGHYVALESRAVNLLPDRRVEALLIHSYPWRGTDCQEVSTSTEEEFLLFIQKAMSRAEADPTDGFCLIRLEVDQIKTLQGTHGEDTASRAAGKVAERLARWLRPDDQLLQQNLGEFLLLLQDIPHHDAALHRADRFRKSLERELDVDGRLLALSATLGLTSSSRRYHKPEQVLRDAQAATNHARRHRSRAPQVFETQMRVLDTQQIMMVADLKVALKSRELMLHYQPIVSLETQRLVGFEALLRWQNRDRGMVSPTEFIPIAEQTGLILPIGRLVLDLGCRQLAKWNVGGNDEPPFFLSLNLSPRQFADEDLFDWVREVIDRHSVDPRQIKLEVTESAVLDNLNGAVALMKRFRDLGVRFSLDDFGTGYSSFSYLYQLPYDTMKLDMSFIRGLEGSEKQRSIVQSITSLGLALGMEVVAEGVETARQAELLRSLGCPLGQGFLFSKPVPPARAAALLKER